MSKTANIIFASRLTEPIMAALTTEVTYVKSEMMRSLHVLRPSTKAQMCISSFRLSVKHQVDQGNRI